MDEDFSLIRWKLIIAVTVGLIFAVFAAFLVLAILVCRQKLMTAKRRKEMLAERLNRRHWLVEQNSNLINHLFTHLQPVDSSIPLPRTCPSAFLNSTPESSNSQNNYSLTSSFSYRPRNEQAFNQFKLSSTSGGISLASKINFKNKVNSNKNIHQSKRGSYMGWTDSSQFDSIGSMTPSLHRNPEKINREACDRSALFECDSGCLNMELSDVNRNSSLAGSDWSQRSNPSSGIESVNNQSIHPVSFCMSPNVRRIHENVFPVI